MSENKHSILIVDDDREFAEAQRELLVSEGYDVFTAESGQEALKILEIMPINLVMLDIRLQDSNGEALIKKMKRIKPVAKYVIMTGWDDPNSHTKALKQGVINYMVKPIQPEKLIGTLDKVLKKRGLNG